MTASAERRRRSTLVAAALTLVAGLLAVGITAVGASTLVNSRAGRDVTADRLPEVPLPATPTGLIAVVDDQDRLTTMAVLVLAPDGVGGSIVPLPATSDSSLGLGDERLPLAATYADEGVDAFIAAAEAMTAVTFDVVEVAPADRVADVVGRLGSVEVDLPTPVVDDDDPDGSLEAGPVVLTPADVGWALTAHTESLPHHALDPARMAVWEALGERVGAGTGVVAPVDEGVEVPTPATLDELIDRLFSDQVGVRPLTATVPPADENPTEADVVVLDRAEVLLVFGQIAPARVAAPNESLTFRIEVGFTEEDLEPFGFNNADAARDVINRSLFVQANVVSVVTDGGDAPDVSRATVADEALVERVEEGWEELLGEIEVEPAEFRIPRVDATIVLGRSYLELRELEAETGSTVPGGLTETTELGPTDDDPTDDDADDDAAGDDQGDDDPAGDDPTEEVGAPG